MEAAPNAETVAEPSVESASAAPTAQVTSPKKRPWLWVVVAVVVLALVGGGYFAFTTMQAQALAKARAAAAIDAEEHWSKATASLQTVIDVARQMGGVKASNAKTEMADIVASLETMKKTATVEIDAAEKAVKVLPAGDAKTNYTHAITNARDAVAAAELAVPALEAAPQFIVDASQVTKAFNKVRSKVNSSIDSSNAQKWDSGLSSAKTALATCRTAEATLKKMDAALDSQSAVGGKADMSAARKVIAVEMDLAQGAVDVATAAKARNRSGYTAAINRYNKSVTKFNKLELPELLTDPLLTFSDGAFTAFGNAEDLFNAAKTYHEKALLASIAKA